MFKAISILSLSLLSYSYSTSDINIPYTICTTPSIMNITAVLSNVWPPKAGELLALTLNGKTDQAIVGGTYVSKSYYEGIDVNTETGDFCKLATCPLKEGDVSIKSSSVITDGLPSGNYKSKLDTKDNNGQTIFCVELEFKM